MLHRIKVVFIHLIASDRGDLVGDLCVLTLVTESSYLFPEVNNLNSTTEHPWVAAKLQVEWKHSWALTSNGEEVCCCSSASNPPSLPCFVMLGLGLQNGFLFHLLALARSAWHKALQSDRKGRRARRDTLCPVCSLFLPAMPLHPSSAVGSGLQLLFPHSKNQPHRVPLDVVAPARQHSLLRGLRSKKYIQWYTHFRQSLSWFEVSDLS